MSKRHKTLTKLALAALASGFLGLASAQTLDMQGTAGAASDDGRPTRGSTQAQVEATYGEPQAKNEPVGDPPISSWEYADMIVYFEYDRVIHAVKKQ